MVAHPCTFMALCWAQFLLSEDVSSPCTPIAHTGVVCDTVLLCSVPWCVCVCLSHSVFPLQIPIRSRGYPAQPYSGPSFCPHEWAMQAKNEL